MTDLRIKDLGFLDYEEVWQSMVSSVKNRERNAPDEVWFVQHPAVYTLGYSGSDLNILEQNNILKAFPGKIVNPISYEDNGRTEVRDLLG